MVTPPEMIIVDVEWLLGSGKRRSCGLQNRAAFAMTRVPPIDLVLGREGGTAGVLSGE